MFLEIEFDSYVPIYLQIRNQIILKIAKGDLKIGDSLPSVRQLASALEINLHTINKAYNLLKSEGYVQVDRRSGAIIKVEKENIFDEYFKKNLSLLIAEGKAKGLTLEEILDLSKEIYKRY